MNPSPLAVPITFPLPFVVDSMNLYLFLARPITLLDTGPKTEVARAAIEKALAAQGLSVRDLQRIIITHGHVDHFGLGRELVRESGAEIYIHRDDAPKLRPGYNFIHEALPLLRGAGVPEEQLREVERWSRKAQAFLDPVDEVSVLEDDASIPFDTFSLKVIHCPGHSQGHICLYHEGRGELFCGDHILTHITSNPAVEPAPGAPEKRSQSLVQYLDSLSSVERLRLSRVFPAHGPVSESPHQRIQDIYEHHRRRKEMLYRLMNREGSTAYELSQSLFGARREMDIFLVVSEVLGHLDLLLREGRGTAQDRDGVIYYAAERV